MTGGSLLEARLRLRPEVMLSRGLLRGPALVHRVKDPRSGRAFEVGVREHFLMTRLDGTRTLAEIGAEYAARFGRRLGEANWRQLITLLGSRDLFAPPDDLVKGQEGGTPEPSGTSRVVEIAYRLVRPALRRWVVLPLIALAFATMALLFAHLGELIDGGGWLIHHELVLVPVAAFAWVSAALHELGHGVAARRYGCRVTRVSVATLHCEVDEYLYLPSLGAQLTISGGGGLVNALILAPVAATWWWLPDSAQARPALAGTLLLGMVQTLVNYVPLPPLDGYRMLGHALGASDLATQSRRFLVLVATRPLRRGPGIGGYPVRARLVYAGYGLGGLALVGGAMTAAVLTGRTLIDHRSGLTGFLVALVAVLMTVAGWLARPDTKESGDNARR